MSTIDTVTKNFISDNEVFADVVNFLIFNSEKVVTPDSLVEMDSPSVIVPYGTDNSGTPVQKERDVIKNVTCKMFSDTVFAIVGIENQTNIHYAMPDKLHLLVDKGLCQLGIHDPLHRSGTYITRHRNSPTEKFVCLIIHLSFFMCKKKIAYLPIFLQTLSAPGAPAQEFGQRSVFLRHLLPPEGSA